MTNIAIKDRPILFSALSVRAILDERKTQTRRIIEPQSMPGAAPLTLEPWFIRGERELDEFGCPCWIGEHPDYESGAKWFSCPYGKEGDLLWVQETWAKTTSGYTYKADISTKLGRRPPLDADEKEGWKSSIYMPREASRITLEVISVRVERLQEISEKDAIAEGIEPNCEGITEQCWGCASTGVCQAEGEWIDYTSPDVEPAYNPTDSFKSLWNSIHGKTYPWKSNPWLWVVEFKQVEQAIAEVKR